MHMTRTTRLCVLAAALYILVICALGVVVPQIVKTPEPDLSLCPFCHK
jgi:hypothetical protein